MLCRCRCPSKWPADFHSFIHDKKRASAFIQSTALRRNWNSPEFPLIRSRRFASAIPATSSTSTSDSTPPSSTTSKRGSNVSRFVRMDELGPDRTPRDLHRFFVSHSFLSTLKNKAKIRREDGLDGIGEQSSESRRIASERNHLRDNYPQTKV